MAKRTSLLKTSQPHPTTIMDLDADTLIHCASFLELPDVSRMSMTSKSFKEAAYSEPIWRSLFKQRFPNVECSERLGWREACAERCISLLQMKYSGSSVAFSFYGEQPINHILLDKNAVITSVGSSLHILEDPYGSEDNIPVTQNDHRADITCMRLFPHKEIFPGETITKDNILITSSADRTIRMWKKGLPIGCFFGQSPVSALSDRLLGDSDGRLLASGGADGNIHLWSLNSLQNSNLVPLKSTFWGHWGAVKLISTLGNKSFLVSVSGAFEMRLWDAAITGYSSCVGLRTLPAEPVGLKCDESLICTVAGSSFMAIDSRSMQRAFTGETGEPNVYSFQALLSKSLVCIGGTNKALLWDIRRMQQQQQGAQIKSVAVINSINGPAQFLHMDLYRIVVAGPEDPYIHVCDTETGRLTNIMKCRTVTPGGFSGMAVNGYRIAAALSDIGVVHLRDFTNADTPFPPNTVGFEYDVWDEWSDEEGLDGNLDDQDLWDQWSDEEDLDGNLDDRDELLDEWDQRFDEEDLDG
ncbi:WD40 repeat [Dillenia turbinata]|uniref:WD40 repeat n=1 Tax=Dillenia turbinata TaxID=194707 RepID=A0AAN8YSC6_9MAGN